MSKNASSVVIWGKNVGGFCSSLQTGLKNLGLNVKFIGPEDYKEYSNKRSFTPFDRILEFLKKNENKLNKKTKNANYFSGTRKILGFCLKLLRFGFTIFLSPITVCWLAYKFNVLIFNFGSTVTNSSIELFFYKLVGRRIIFVFHGSEVRPKYLNGKSFPPNRDINWAKMHNQVKRQIKLIRRVEKYADQIIAWHAILHFFKTPVLIHDKIGFPVMETNHKSEIVNHLEKFSESKNEITILHSPSHKTAKGTSYIVSTIKELIHEGYRINFIQLRGIPNTQVRKIIKNSDIIVDQAYSDNPYGVLAIESGLEGIPVIVGGPEAVWFHRKFNMNTPPTNYIQTDDLKNGIRTLLLDKERRIFEGKKLKKFLQKNWHIDEISKRYLAIISGDKIEEMQYSSLDDYSVFGGYSEDTHLQKLVSGYIQHFGTSELYLDHNPELKKKVIDFSKNGRCH